MTRRRPSRTARRSEGLGLPQGTGRCARFPASAARLSSANMHVDVRQSTLYACWVTSKNGQMATCLISFRRMLLLVGSVCVQMYSSRVLVSSFNGLGSVCPVHCHCCNGETTSTTELQKEQRLRFSGCTSAAIYHEVSHYCTAITTSACCSDLVLAPLYHS
jgi:hypothetical protein